MLAFQERKEGAYKGSLFLFYKVYLYMNKQRKIIKKILSQIEELDDSLFCYATMVSNGNNSHYWYQISVSQFEFYMHDERFKALSQKWHKVCQNMKIPIIFVCGWKPTEEKLLQLANEDNLILNV